MIEATIAEALDIPTPKTIGSMVDAPVAAIRFHAQIGFAVAIIIGGHGSMSQ